MPAGTHAVIVAGVELSCLVDAVSIVHGRDDTGSQPQASSATIDITVTPEDPLPAGVDVGASLVVTTTTPGGVSTRFVGLITDVALGWDDAGEDTPDAGVGQLVAVGPLGDLGRRVVGDVPWPLELDGARVSRVMAAAGVTLDPLTSDPGTVKILPRDVDATAALEAAHAAAVDASGVLWQTRAGEIRYADSSHRRGIPSTLTLDACDLLVTPTWRRNLEGLVNRVSIAYGLAPEGGEQPVFDEESPDSINRWGRYGYSTTTTLAELVDAESVGRLLLARNGSPVWVMAALPVDVTGLDAARYDALLGLDVHSLVSLTGLPSLGTAPTSSALWVEGYKETLTYGGHELELTVSGYCRTVPAPRWDDADPEWTWGGGEFVEARRNIFRNPGVTVDTSHWSVWDWWGNHTGTGARVIGDGPPVGQDLPYYRITWTSGHATNGGEAGAKLNQPATDGIRVTAGRPFTASAYFRSSGTATTGACIRATFYGESSNQDGAALYGTAVPVGGGLGWVRLTLTTTVPPNSTRCVVEAMTYGASPPPLVPGQTTDIGAVLVEHAATAGSYFDGDTPDTGSADHAWAETRGASESVLSELAPLTVLVEARRNLARNPAVTVSSGHWAFYTAAVGTVTLTLMPATDGPDIPGTGRRPYMRATWDTIGSGGPNGPGFRYAVGTPGAYASPGPVRVSFWVRQVPFRSGASSGARLSCEDANGTRLAGAFFSGGDTPLVAGWQRYTSSQFTAPAGTVRVSVEMPGNYGPTWVVGNCYDVTGLLVEQVSTVGDYFDGDTPDTGTVDHAWAGSAGASESILSTKDTDVSGMPPSMLWDDAACLGPPVSRGRWNDQPMTLRWDQIAADITWDTYPQ